MLSDLQSKNRPISFEEFIEIICGRIGDTKSKDGIEKVFNLYDKDTEGVVDFEKFKIVCRELGETMTD
jgi:Ca2+-binding EF-hand superfamily protein